MKRSDSTEIPSASELIDKRIAALAQVKFAFAMGASLRDAGTLFHASLDGNTRRAIDIHEGDSVDPRAFNTLIRDAVDLNTALGMTGRKKGR